MTIEQFSGKYRPSIHAPSGSDEEGREFDADLDALLAAERERTAQICDLVHQDYRGADQAAKEIRGCVEVSE